MTTTDKMDKKGIRVAIAVAFALIVDGLDLQVLALSLPSIMKDMHVSPGRYASASRRILRQRFFRFPERTPFGRSPAPYEASDCLRAYTAPSMPVRRSGLPWRSA